MSFFDDQLAAGLASIRAAAGDTVTYSRPSANQSTPITAAKGRTVYESTDADNVTITITSTDFLFGAADLVLGNQPTTPQAGDTITDATGTYEAMSVGGKDVFGYQDPTRTGIRMHTKQVA